MADRSLVVEDEVKLAGLLRDYLVQEGFDVAVLNRGDQVEEWVRTHEVDLVLLDLMLPGKNGLDVCKALRAATDVSIVMVTARVDEIDRLLGLELGADDYICKPFSPREVVARVQALLRRGAQSAAPSATTSVGDLEVDFWARQARVAGRTVALTPTEFRLLAALARHPGRIFTRDELVARVFGPDYDGLDRTIDAHVTNLRRKLEPGEEPRYVLTAHGLGYRLATKDDVG